MPALWVLKCVCVLCCKLLSHYRTPTWNGSAEHVRVDVDEAVDDTLLPQSRRATLGNGFSAVSGYFTVEY